MTKKTDTKNMIRPPIKTKEEVDFINSSKTEAAEKMVKPAKSVEKPNKKIGRPIRNTKPRRNKNFALPLALIEKIDRESYEFSGGNSSAFAARLFEAYFTAKEEGQGSVVFGIEVSPKG